jgi:hypothetical protein
MHVQLFQQFQNTDFWQLLTSWKKSGQWSKAGGPDGIWAAFGKKPCFEKHTQTAVMCGEEQIVMRRKNKQNVQNGSQFWLFNFVRPLFSLEVCL